MRVSRRPRGGLGQRDAPAHQLCNGLRVKRHFVRLAVTGWKKRQQVRRPVFVGRAQCVQHLVRDHEIVGGGHVAVGKHVDDADPAFLQPHRMIEFGGFLRIEVHQEQLDVGSRPVEAFGNRVGPPSQVEAPVHDREDAAVDGRLRRPFTERRAQHHFYRSFDGDAIAACLALHEALDGREVVTLEVFYIGSGACGRVAGDRVDLDPQGFLPVGGVECR